MGTNSTPTTPLAAWYAARRQQAAETIVRRGAPEDYTSKKRGQK